MGGMAPEPLRPRTASVQIIQSWKFMKINRIIVCVALMLLTVGANAKTEKVWIQGSVGKLSAVVQVPDGLAEGEKCPVVILMHDSWATRTVCSRD